GIGNLKRLGQQVLMNTVVTKPNCRDLPAIARLLAGLGADQVQFAYPHLSGRAAQNCGWLVARKSRVAPWIKRAIDAAVAAGIPAFTEAIPHCLMRGYERHVVERLIPDTMIFDATTVVADFTKARQNEDKAKGPRCGACARFKDCEGPWKEYPERFGWSEFVPIPRP
ncbi:MAG: hypothetical protein KGK30_00555, partial [Elusimicrobia bacterium]|nr:hypothetical protein [Elusimicrobiota bacterium]